MYFYVIHKNIYNDNDNEMNNIYMLMRQQQKYNIYTLVYFWYLIFYRRGPESEKKILGMFCDWACRLGETGEVTERSRGCSDSSSS